MSAARNFSNNHFIKTIHAYKQLEKEINQQQQQGKAMDKRETLAPCVTTLNSQSFNSEIIRLLIIIKHSNTVGKIIIKGGPSCTWLRKIWTLVSSVIWSIFYCFLLVLFHLSLSKSIIGSRDSTISI